MLNMFYYQIVRLGIVRKYNMNMASTGIFWLEECYRVSPFVYILGHQPRKSMVLNC